MKPTGSFTLIIACFAAAIPSLVSAQPDLKGCITSVVTNTIKEGGHLGAMIDASQCIVNGTIGKCQLQCMFDVNACMPARDPQCLNTEFQQCVNTCFDNPNFFTTGCFNAALDVISFVPTFGVVVSFYQIFTGCVDVAAFGLSWVRDVIISAATALGAQLGPVLCQSLQNYIPFPICPM